MRCMIYERSIFGHCWLGHNFGILQRVRGVSARSREGYSYLHEVCQLVSIYQDPALIHGENAYTEDTVHPVVRSRSLEL